MGGYIAEPSSDSTIAPEEEHTSVSEESFLSVSKEALSSVSKEVDTESTPSEEGKLTEPAPNIMQGLPNLDSTTLRRSSWSQKRSEIVLENDKQQKEADELAAELKGKPKKKRTLKGLLTIFSLCNTSDLLDPTSASSSALPRSMAQKVAFHTDQVQL